MLCVVWIVALFPRAIQTKSRCGNQAESEVRTGRFTNGLIWKMEGYGRCVCARVNSSAAVKMVQFGCGFE